MKSLLRSALTPALLAVAFAANAAVIDFENLPNGGTPGQEFITFQGGSVVSGGFLFTTTATAGPFSTPFATPSGLVPGNFLNYTGSVALTVPFGGDPTITMAPVGGGVFDLNSLGLANLYTSSSGFGQTSAIRITGTQVGGGKVTANITVAAGDAIQSKTFSGFTNLTSVTWDQADHLHQFDNINVTVQAAPEPSALAALGLGAVALLRRRRK